MCMNVSGSSQRDSSSGAATRIEVRTIMLFQVRNSIEGERLSALSSRRRGRARRQ